MHHLFRNVAESEGQNGGRRSRLHCTGRILKVKSQDVNNGGWGGGLIFN